MRLSEGVEWAAHCAVVLSTVPPDKAIPAATLAEFHGVPGPYLAKSLQALARAGIIASVAGRHGGYRLTRPASEITLLDIVRAVDGDDRFFRCTEIRQRGPNRAPTPTFAPICAIAAAMYRAEDAWRAELERTTVAAIAEQVSKQVPAEALERGVRWIEVSLARRHPADEQTSSKRASRQRTSSSSQL